MNIAGKRILVTGGAGFIGSQLVKKLLNQKCEVYVADNFSRGKKENLEPFLDKVNLYHVDLTMLENCLLTTKEIDYVFHLAASVGGIQYILKENVGGLTPSLLMNANMLEAARLSDVERFLFTSSACVYKGKESGLNRFKEEDAIPANPLTTYGWAKLMGEIQCKAYCTDYGIKSSVVRIFNAYGENEELNPKWSHVIPSFIRKAILYPTEEFRIYGDGKQERAFLHVDDCVKGLILCMDKTVDAEPINLGGEEVVSINDLSQRIIKISGKKIKVQYDFSGPKGTYKYCADTTKMKQVLEWNPKIKLNDGLRRTYDWAERKIGVEK